MHCSNDKVPYHDKQDCVSCHYPFSTGCHLLYVVHCVALMQINLNEVMEIERICNSKVKKEDCFAAFVLICFLD